MMMSDGIETPDGIDGPRLPPHHKLTPPPRWTPTPSRKGGVTIGAARYDLFLEESVRFVCILFRSSLIMDVCAIRKNVFYNRMLLQPGYTISLCDMWIESGGHMTLRKRSLVARSKKTNIDPMGDGD